MGKRVFSREFKFEAVKLVKERGVSQSQAARDLGIHVNVLRKWIADFNAGANQAFPGRGKMRPDERDILKKP
jgi:transposase